MAVRVCPLCQAEFLEFKNTCTHCGVALIDPSEDVDIRLLEEDEQVVYDLSAWPIDAQTETSMLFAESGLPHQWDGTDLIVPEIHETSADRLLERIEDQFGLVSDEERDMLAEESAEQSDEEPGSGVYGRDTEYDLSDWPTSRRMEMVERLVELGVPHHWDDECLVVPTTRESEVDGILDEMGEGVEGAPAAPAGERIESSTVASMLFLAAERMRKGKVDARTYGDLLENLEGADGNQPPFGWDPKVWEQALELGDDLADAVAEDTDEIEEIASTLYALLRPLI
jgi:hypothetical protein